MHQGLHFLIGQVTRMVRMLRFDRKGRSSGTPNTISRIDTERLRATELAIEGTLKDNRSVPLVSIILPTYNRAKVIARAIRSVMNQSYQRWELIIVDDGSVDQTASIVRSFQDPRISYLYQYNSGVSAARNLGLTHANGSVIAFLDSDNFWDREYLTYTIAYMRAHNLDSVYSILRMIDSSDNVQSYRAKEYDSEDLNERNYIDLNVYAFNKKLIEDGTSFDNQLRRAVDWDFIVRTSRKGTCELAYFCQCSYLAEDDESRLTNSELTLYTKIVRAKNYYHVADSERIVRLARLSAGIHIAAPADQRIRWGDYHYARSIQKQLILLGYDAKLVYRESNQKQRDKFDLNIVLRGRQSLRLRKTALNILWVISHPETVTVEEALSYRIVFCASDFMRNILRVEGCSYALTLLQASDPDLFFEQPGEVKKWDAIFVGRTRGVQRKFIVDTVKNLPNARVIGDGWEQYVPESKILAKQKSYSAVAKEYRSAKVVLSEHWRSMRLFGIVANRVFDAIGSGAMVLSDKVRGDEFLASSGRYISYGYEQPGDIAFDAIADVSRSSTQLSSFDLPSSFNNRVETIAREIHKAIFSRQSNDSDSAPCTLKLERGHDWKQFEWQLINNIIPTLPTQCMVSLNVISIPVQGHSRCYIQNNEIPIEKLSDTMAEYFSLSSISPKGPLDEKFWRLFDLGRYPESRSDSVCCISPDPMDMLERFPSLKQKYRTIRIWSPMLDCRSRLAGGGAFSHKQFNDSTRARIRRFMLDFEAETLIIDQELEDPSFFCHVGLSQGACVIGSGLNKAKSELPSALQMYIRDTEERSDYLDSIHHDAEKCRNSYWEYFGDEIR